MACLSMDYKLRNKILHLYQRDFPMTATNAQKTEIKHKCKSCQNETNLHWSKELFIPLAIWHLAYPFRNSMG